jgi:dienelactone hydrolase
MKIVTPALFLSLVIFLTVGGDVMAGQVEEVTYRTDPDLKGYLCRPEENGPFPAAIFNHGGLGDIIGGAPEGTCEALAEAGFVGFPPIRRLTRSMRGHVGDVLAGLEYLRGLDQVDRNRVSMIGFSRGAALTFMAASKEISIKRAVIMASAFPPPRSGFTLKIADQVEVPVLLLVAENGTGSRKTRGQDTLAGMRRMEDALTSAGNPPRLIVYPPYGNDGHEMFFEIGKYWSDVIDFISQP